MSTEIEKIINVEMAHVACLLDLLADHPAVLNNCKLYGAIEAIKSQYTDVWNRLEAEFDKSMVLSLDGDQ